MAKKVNVKEELFVLYYDGKPLHMVPEKWNEWKKSKKVYWTESAAKLGIEALPDEIDRSRITIVQYGPKDT